jgi:hypothetical protein
MQWLIILLSTHDTDDGWAGRVRTFFQKKSKNGDDDDEKRFRIFNLLEILDPFVIIRSIQSLSITTKRIP